MRTTRLPDLNNHLFKWHWWPGSVYIPRPVQCGAGCRGGVCGTGPRAALPRGRRSSPGHRAEHPVDEDGKLAGDGENGHGAPLVAGSAPEGNPRGPCESVAGRGPPCAGFRRRGWTRCPGLLMPERLAARHRRARDKPQPGREVLLGGKGRQIQPGLGQDDHPGGPGTDAVDPGQVHAGQAISALAREHRQAASAVAEGLHRRFGDPPRIAGSEHPRCARLASQGGCVLGGIRIYARLRICWRPAPISASTGRPTPAPSSTCSAWPDAGATASRSSGRTPLG